MQIISRKVGLLVAALLVTAGCLRSVWSQQVDEPREASQLALEEILTTQKGLSLEGRDNNDPDGAKWGALITSDFTEFNPLWPYRLEGKAMNIALQVAYDANNKPAPTPPVPGATHPKPTIQLYGNVAIVSAASVRQGEPIVRGGFMQQRKTSQVWVKTGGKWQLAHCDCEWLSGPDGIPY